MAEAIYTEEQLNSKIAAVRKELEDKQQTKLDDQKKDFDKQLSDQKKDIEKSYKEAFEKVGVQGIEDIEKIINENKTLTTTGLKQKLLAEAGLDARLIDNVAGEDIETIDKSIKGLAEIMNSGAPKTIVDPEKGPKAESAFGDGLRADINKGDNK